MSESQKEETPDEAQRRKFREAIEAKRGGGGSGKGAGAAGKASGATANATTQRMFRRKSG